jgi:hypothetical protein
VCVRARVCARAHVRMCMCVCVCACVCRTLDVGGGHRVEPDLLVQVKRDKEVPERRRYPVGLRTDHARAVRAVGAESRSRLRRGGGVGRRGSNRHCDGGKAAGAHRVYGDLED